MDKVVEALAPVFVVSVALQQLLELLDPVLDVVIRPHKKGILSAVALGTGLGVSLVLRLRILGPLGVTQAEWLDVILTALFVTGGTKAFNDLLKWMGYKKEAARRAANPEASHRAAAR